MSIGVVVAIMGLLVLGLTFLSRVSLISNGDEGRTQDRMPAANAGSQPPRADAPVGGTAGRVAL